MDDIMPQGHNENQPDEQVNTNHEGGKAGPIIGIVIIIVVLLIGVLYFWGQKTAELNQPIPSQVVAEPDQTDPEVIEDDFASMETELEDDFASMEAELDTAF